MSFLHILAGRETPARRLEDAVRNNNIVVLDKLLNEGLDPNTRVHIHGGDRAVHVAAILGHFRCLETLAAAGADLETPNDVHVTPLFSAARSSHPRAMQAILCHSPNLSEILTLWEQDRWKQVFRGGLGNMEVLFTLFYACPDTDRILSTMDSHLIFLNNHNLYIKVVKMLLLLGEWAHSVALTLAVGRIAAVRNEVAAESFLNWYTRFTKEPLGLKQLCGVTIRRSFFGKCNVYYGVYNIHLPHRLRDFLIMNINDV